MIGIADQHGVIPKLARLKRPIRMPPVKRRAVHRDAVIMLIKSGMDRRARRRAGRSICKMTLKQDALRTKRVQIWRLHNRMAKRGKAIATPLVSRDKKNILRSAH